MAGLYKYFKLQPALPKSSETGLGDTVTKEANSAVRQVLEEPATNTTVTATGRKRKYTHFTPEQRAKIAKYAVQCGNTAATRHFSQEFPTLGESTVRVFKKQYQEETKKKGTEEEISSLPKKKRGRPLTLGELDNKVQQYVRSLRRAGVPINARIVMAAAEGIVKATDRTLLAQNGGHMNLTLA